MADDVEVGKGVVSILPVMGSIGRALDKEVRKATGSIDKTGRRVGLNFGKALSAGAGDGMQEAERRAKSLASAVESAANKVTTAREKEADAARKAAIAQKVYNDAVEKYGDESAQALRAEDRNIKATREHTRAKALLTAETKRHEEATAELTEQTREAGKAAERTKRTWKDLAGDFRRGLVGRVKVDVDDSSQTAARAELGWLSRSRVVTLLPNVSKAAGARAAADIASLTGITGVTNSLSSVGNTVRGMFDNAPKVALLTTAIGGLGIMAGASAVNVLSLAGSLAAIAPAALALPGIFAGFAVGAVTLTAALADAGTVLPGVVKGFKRLQNTISREFWARAAEPIRRLSDTLLPALSAGMGQVSSELGGFVGQMASAARARLVPQLAPMFDHLAKSIRAARGAIAPLTDLVATLGLTGSAYLPGLSRWFVDISNKLNGFIQGAAKSGALQEWIDAGIQGLKDLGRVITGAAGVLGGLVRAASKAGGSTLSTLADSLHGISDAVNAPGFQKALTGAFDGFLKGAAAVTDIAGPAVSDFFKAFASNSAAVLPTLGKAFGTLVSGVATALSTPAFQNGVRLLTTGIAEGLKAAAPYFDDIGDGLGVLLGVLGQAVRVAFPLLLGILGVAGKALVRLQGPLEKLFAVGVEMAPVLQRFAGELLAIGRQAMPVLIAAAKQIAAAFRKHWPAIKALISEVGAVILELARTIVPILRRYLPPVIKIFSAVFGAVLGVIRGAVKVIGGYLKIIRGIFTGDFSLIKEGVLDIAHGMFDQIAALLRGAYKIAKVLLTRYLKFWMGIGESIANGLIGAFTRLWSWVRKTFLNWWRSTTGLFKEPLQKVLDWVGRVFGKGGHLRRVFREAVDAVGRIWSGIEALAKKPVKFIIDTVLNNGLIKGVNWIADKLGMGENGKPWIAPISLPGFRDGGPTGNVAKNAVAGVVHGREHVVTAEEVEKTPGGHRTWANIRAMASRGLLAGFRGGGPVPPVPGPGSQHSGYGWATYAGDFPQPMGTPVRSWKDGIVAAVKYLTTSYGKHVRVNHSDGTSSLYAHLSRIGVQIGDALRAGQVLGRVGSTGNSSGPHLHFETMGGPYTGGSGGNVFSRLFNWGKDKLGNLISGARGFLETRMPSLSPLDKYGRFGELLKGIPGRLVGGAVDWAKSSIGSMAAPGGSGVARWTGHVRRALGMVGLPVTEPYISAWLSQIRSESGGNPNITQQVHDVNSGGNEARGLVQVIPGTFAAYRSPRLPNDRTNPLANLFAGMNYAKARYGFRGMLDVIGHGHGYARGTRSALPGVALVGEQGPELVRFRGGEQVTPSHATASALRHMRGTSTPPQVGDIYVQNPVTGEYLLAQFDARADARIRRTIKRGATARV